ncbi:MAG: polysaccharide biosynthesis C-terminal domain-containing protein [Clostridia bacterium]|nr:polysaccharide biosynthesis C-terminal domain-containing protein [Clostridia bacterium]
MNRYKRLLSNTFVFAIGTFSSKVLVYFLVPLYTHVLTNAQFGSADLIQQTGNLLLPLASLGITTAVLRFGLDSAVRKTDVFTAGLLCVMFGSGALLLLSPLWLLVRPLAPYSVLLMVFAVMSTLRSLCSQFVRSQSRVRLFALDGLLSTATMLLLTILFLTVFRWGVTGYIAAIVCSDFLSVLFLTVTGRLWRYVGFSGLQPNVLRQMLRFALPLIPNTLLWWITNVSDRYFVIYMMGEEHNGPYAIAYKIPALIILVAGVFMNAWQISAVTEQEDRERFYSKVGNHYTSILMIVASLILLGDRMIIRLWVAEDYYIAWQYVPLLTLATVCTCLVDFLGSIYLVEKKSVHSMLTAAVSAVMNLILNAVLIPVWGVNGAAAATLLCYFTVFLIRFWDTRRYIKVAWHLPRLCGGFAILAAQTVLLWWDVPYLYLWEGLLTLAMLVLHGNSLMRSVKTLLHSRRAARQDTETE